IWQKKFSRANDATYFSTMHDHILCYCKFNVGSCTNGWKIGLLPRGEEIPNGYANPDNDPRGYWTSVILSAKSGSDSAIYEIETPSGRKVLPPSGRYWCCSKETFEKWKSDGRIWFGSDGDGTPRKKTFLSEVQAGLRPNTIIFHTEGGHNQEGKQEMKALFDDLGVFDGPKPVRLLHYLSVIANLDKDTTILDFFSGSATTAHAVMKLNAEDGGNRKFIMVQLPEKTDEKSEAYKAGYNNICEIGKERIRRAGIKVKEEAGKSAQNLDTGFRVLKLDSSNMEDVYYTPQEFELQSLFNENVKADRTNEDLLFQVMLDLGIELSAKIECKQIAGKNVHFVDDNYLVACFDSDVNESTITEIAKLQPIYFVMRDASAANDNVIDNFEQIFKHYSPDTNCRII
ncbi:site-specific DNA-methyltransferase, partial [Bacteroidales bacterium SW292]|nr:site-specific DNA-methyltransferase [Bacteroidales bacterium SW292]